MMNRKRTYRHIMKSMTSVVGILSALFLLTGCINEDLSDCGTDNLIEYELKDVSNLQDEILSKLTQPEELVAGNELYRLIKPAFQNMGQDLELSFFTEQKQLERHENIRMDASQASYTVYLPAQNYLHVAVANEQIEKQLFHHQAETLIGNRFSVAPGDTVQSQQTGVYTGRLPMTVGHSNQAFHVSLYMINAAEALVLDKNNQPVQSVKAYVKDLATTFYVNDSTYAFEGRTVMPQQLFESKNGRHLCFYGFGLASRETPAGLYKTLSPDDTGVADQALWSMDVYVKMDNGKITKSTLYIKSPLRAGKLKLIKALVNDKGAVVTRDNEVGVSVTIDWKPGGEYEGDFG